MNFRWFGAATRSTFLVAMLGGSVQAQVAAPADEARAPTESRRITLSRLGYPDGLALDGATAAGSLSFPLPPGVPLRDARISLALDITRMVTTGSNVQVFINGARRLMIPRTPVDSSPMTVVLPLVASDLGRNALQVEVRSFLAIGHDRCIDERLGSAYVTVLPESNLTYAFDPRDVLSPEAQWATLQDTVTVALPRRALTASEFSLAYDLARELRTGGHRERFIRESPADISLDSARTVRALLAWRHLAAGRPRVLPDNPSFQQLGISDLTRLYGYRASWRLPIDLRNFPADRVPSGLDLEVASAAGPAARSVQYFIFMNGTLLRAFVGNGDGASQSLHVDLPQYLLTTYNEVRVDVQRQRDASDYCQQAEALFPAQISGSSIVRTERATNSAHLFTGAAVKLADHFPLYVPRAALDSSNAYLRTLVSLSRGLWGERAPRFEFYASESDVLPDRGFVLVGGRRALSLSGPVSGGEGDLTVKGDAIGTVGLMRPASEAFTAEVAESRGQMGIVAVLPSATAEVPDTPEAYGNADAVIRFPPNAAVRVSSSGLPAEQLYGSFLWLHRWSWTPQLLLGLALFVLILALLVYTVWQRDLTARRRLRANEGG